MIRNSLSILIPVYNSDCSATVEELCQQAEAISGFDYEVIVADDGSSLREMVDLCRHVASLPHCRFIDRGVNVGRAAIRNFLANEAHYDWLLFLDCDMTILSADFLKTYLELVPDSTVIYGGYKVGNGTKSNLRYLYEKNCEWQQQAIIRQKRPWHHFHTANFLVSRQVILAHPFDERFRRYGYEDVLWGRQLRQAGISISHIDNKTGFNKFEDNNSFVVKTEEGLETLYQFRSELRSYSHLLTVVEGIHIPAIRCLLRWWHRLFGRLERRQLCSSHPSLRVFKLYKLGYYLSLLR